MKVSLFIRRVIENATRNWIYLRRLPKASGGARIFVSPSAGLKFLLKPMSMIESALLRNVIEVVRPNDVVWDIGANIGLFAFAAAARSGRDGQIIAFEPDAWLVQILRKSAAAQPHASAPVKVIPAAIAAQVSLRQFIIGSRSRASSAIVGYGRSQIGELYDEQTVVALSLDWLSERLPPPNVIKCDVEGAEVEVLFGQSKIFEKSRPVIICEVGAQASDRITNVLIGERYRLYDGDAPLSARTEVEKASWNTIAIPQELVSRFIC